MASIVIINIIQLYIDQSVSAVYSSLFKFDYVDKLAFDYYYVKIYATFSFTYGSTSIISIFRLPSTIFRSKIRAKTISKLLNAYII